MNGKLANKTVEKQITHLLKQTRAEIKDLGLGTVRFTQTETGIPEVKGIQTIGRDIEKIIKGFSKSEKKELRKSAKEVKEFLQTFVEESPPL